VRNPSVWVKNWSRRLPEESLLAATVDVAKNNAIETFVEILIESKGGGRIRARRRLGRIIPDLQ